MIRTRIPAAIAIAAMAFVSHHSATAQVVFSESFEAPVVSGYVVNTAPSGGKWIASTVEYGTTWRGLYRTNVQWPTLAPFTTPFGEQAYFCNYSNSGLTTAVGVTGQTLTAGVRYQVTFHAAASAGYPTANYRVELVAFGPADDNNARKNCQSSQSLRPGTVLAFAGGSVTTTDMSSRFTISYTPDGGNVHLGKDLGIRLIYAGGGSANSVLYDNIRLITGHDLNPSPANGENLKVAGNVTLGWTNMPPVAPATTTPVDVWFGSNPAALTQVVDGQLVSSKVVSANSAGTWYWRVDSYPDGNANGTPVTGQVFSFTIADTDADGIPDVWETQYFGGPTAANPSLDTDTDGLTNLQEYTRGTNPIIADTDSDGLLDGVESATNTWLSAANTGTHPLIADTDKDGFRDGAETNTGTWLSAASTGTNPNDPDWDKDGLKDGAETSTGIYVDRFNAGSNPFLADTDNDGAGDWYEACATFTNPGSAAQTSPIPYPLPKPDGSDGATNKPVKVYIIMGQSNATGIAQVNGTLPGTLETIVKRENRFPNLLDGSNNWLPRNDVLYRRAPVSGPAGPLAPGQGASSSQMGPELGFGQVMGWFHDEPVLILKASQGNRSLGVDFLPPGSTRWDYNGYTYAGYGDSPERWLIGSIPVPGSIYAGRQYDTCFHNLPDYAVPPPSWANATAYTSGALIGHNGQIYSCYSNHTSDATTEPGVGVSWWTRWANFDSAPEILAKFGTYYPQWAAQGYEIAGFCWWQGHKDQDGTDNPLATKYQDNLVNYINAVRAEFNAPSAPFVVATIGFGGEPLSNKEVDFQQVFNAQMAVQNLPQFAGTVKSIDILKYWRTFAESPSGEDFHYNQNAETYMLVGDAMGRAMVALQPETSPPTPNPPTFAIAPAAVNSTTIGMVATTALDVSGPVRYYFENLTNSTNSGWITSTRWDSTGLTTGVSHTFRFKAKDANSNETGWSAEKSAAPANDVTAPEPDPMTFAAPLTVLGENSIAMTASPATDINGVFYQFVCTAGGGPNSSWQSSPEFTATGLSPTTSYTYIVRAKDSAGNTTADSAPASATTLAVDTTEPTPATMSFATPPTALGTNAITMTATTASDPSSVEYFFEAVSGGTSSAWQNSPTYTDSSLTPGTQYGYRVRARDKSPAQTATAWSAVFNATTEIPDETAPVIAQLSPLNGAINVPLAANLVITFDEDIALGTGSITLKNLTDSTQTTIAITDSAQVSATGAILTINPIANLAYGKKYAVQIANTAIKDFSDNIFGGVLNDSTWSFNTTVIGPYYWDGNDNASAFGTAQGTWADPTAGTLTSGWSTSPAGTATVNGNSVTTTTADTINFGATNVALAAGTITVSGTVNAGSIFQYNYVPSITLTGGTINFANTVSIGGSGSTNTFDVDSLITGAATSITFTNGSRIHRFLNTANTYTGSTNISGSLEVKSLADGGLNSSVGASSSAASNLVFNNSAFLTYTGTTNASTNRLFTNANGATINNNGSGALVFTNSGSLAYGTADQTRALVLGGTNTGGNTFNPLIANNGTGAVSFTKNGAGTWVLANNANSYTGQTTIAGTLSIGSIADYDTNSAIGKGTAGTAILLGNSATTGTLIYTGAEIGTNRTIQINSSTNASTGGATILNNGTGALTFSASTFNATYTNGNAVIRALTLGGTNGGTISGTIQNSTTAVRTDLIKIGSGSWTLAGSNTYTGSTTLNAGTLKLDYSTNNTSKLSETAASNAGVLNLNGGTLELSGGSHTEAVLSTTLNNGTTFIRRTGGVSSALSMGVIAYNGGALDFSAAGIANVSTSAVTNGILSSAGGAARVTVGGADWATKDGSNNVVAYTGYTSFAGGATLANVNYSSVGNVTLDANRGAASNTFKIITSASGQSMALVDKQLTLGSILFAGAHDYSITNTTGRINSAFLLHHYGSGTLTLGATNGAITQYGNGKTILSGNNASDVGINIFGGTVQFSNNLQIGTNAAARVIALNNGTLLADATGGDIALNNGGLFSRTVSLGAGGGTLDVIGGNKLTVSGVISDTAGQFPTLTIGSASSNGTIEFTATNTYTGLTTIAGGTLVITGATQSTNSIKFTGGSLGLNTGFPVTAASAAVDLTNGTIKVTGSTGAPSYTLLTAASITGTPVLAAPVSGYQLQVIDGATDELRLVQTGGGSPYDTWSGGAPFGGDSNNDGISNGLAFLLGVNGPNINALDKLPTVTQSAGGLTLNFSMLNDTANGNATLAIEYSNSLAEGSWTAVQVPYSSGTVGDIGFNITGTGPLNVTAAIPVSKAAAGKLFGRVKAVNP